MAWIAFRFGTRASMAFQEANERLMPVMRHASAGDLAFQDVEGAEQSRGGLSAWQMRAAGYLRKLRIYATIAFT